MQWSKWTIFQSDQPLRVRSVQLRPRWKKSNLLLRRKLNLNHEMSQYYWHLICSFQTIRILMQGSKWTILQSNPTWQWWNFRMRPWWKKSSLYLRLKMNLIMEINQGTQHVSEFLDYQNSKPGNKMTCYLKEYSCTCFYFSVEALME